MSAAGHLSNMRRYYSRKAIGRMPSFIGGFGSVIDLSGRTDLRADEYRCKREIADQLFGDMARLKSDLKAVTDDFKKAVITIVEEKPD